MDQIDAGNQRKIHQFTRKDIGFRIYIGLPVGRSKKEDKSRNDLFSVRKDATCQVIKVITTTFERNAPVPTKKSATFQ